MFSGVPSEIGTQGKDSLSGQRPMIPNTAHKLFGDMPWPFKYVMNGFLLPWGKICAAGEYQNENELLCHIVFGKVPPYLKLKFA